MKAADQPNAVCYVGDGYDPLPVVRVQFAGTPALVTAWELSDQDMLDVQHTGRIWITLLGSAQPPISVTTRCPYAADPLADQDG